MDEIEETQGNKNLVVAVVVIMLLVVGGVFYFMSRQGQEALEPAIPQEATVPGSGVDETVVVDEDLDDVREIAVQGDEYQFTPRNLSVSSGERVRIVFTNTGSQPHDLVIEELGVSTELIEPGETDVIEFTVSESGVYGFYCSFGDHRQLGMEGEVVVE